MTWQIVPIPLRARLLSHARTHFLYLFLSNGPIMEVSCVGALSLSRWLADSPPHRTATLTRTHTDNNLALFLIF